MRTESIVDQDSSWLKYIVYNVNESIQQRNAISSTEHTLIKNALNALNRLLHNLLNELK